MPEFIPAPGRFRQTLHRIVFLSDTPAGRRFDLWLIVAIMASVGIVMLDSVESLHNNHATAFWVAEWFFTVLFTAEYLVRLAIVRHPLRYATSFFGLVDLLSVLPTYVSLLVPGAQVLLVVRILRVLRVFRVLKLAHYVSEADQLGRALAASRRKIAVFVFTVLVIVTVAGSMMYLVEGGQNGFDSIPRSVYWAVVTLTTVGYGDISPVTPLGQALALVIMVMGYGIIAVPTGIVTVELNRNRGVAPPATEGPAVAASAMPTPMAHPPAASPAGAAAPTACSRCGLASHDADARFCKRCGSSLAPGR